MSEIPLRSAAQDGAARLRLVFLLTLAFTAVEVAGGYATGSLALIADAGHMLADVSGVGMALLAIRFGSRPATARQTYGYYRLEIVAALVNGLLLWGIAVYILVEAYWRLSSPPDILGGPMLAVATAGLVVNLVSAFLLFEGQKDSLNLRGAFLEVVSDLVGSLAVIVAGVVVLTTGFRLVDPIVSIFIGLFILPRSLTLLRDALHVLLEGAPRRVDLAHVRDHILSADGVTSVHDLHVWSLTSGMDVVSAHVVIEPAAAPQAVLEQLSACLSQHFDIEHSTFQIEQPDRSSVEHGVH
jgi:cobalt-zinc-cadmium efflux system protein